MAIVRKTRLEQFPDGETFEWSFDALAERWGAERLGREAARIEMASPEQVDALARKVKALNLPEDTIDKWLKKAEAETFSEMTAEVIQKCIDYCDARLAEAANGSAASPKKGGKR